MELVYPGENYSPYCSLRLKVFYDGIEDYTLLKQLENKKGREYVLNLVNEAFPDLSFNNYPHSESILFDFMRKIKYLLK